MHYALLRKTFDADALLIGNRVLKLQN